MRNAACLVTYYALALIAGTLVTLTPSPVEEP